MTWLLACGNHGRVIWNLYETTLLFEGLSADKIRFRLGKSFRLGLSVTLIFIAG